MVQNTHSVSPSTDALHTPRAPPGLGWLALHKCKGNLGFRPCFSKRRDRVVTSRDRMTFIGNDDCKKTSRDVLMAELRFEPRTNQHGCLPSRRSASRSLTGRPRRRRTFPYEYYVSGFRNWPFLSRTCQLSENAQIQSRQAINCRTFSYCCARSTRFETAFLRPRGGRFGPGASVAGRAAVRPQPAVGTSARGNAAPGRRWYSYPCCKHSPWVSGFVRAFQPRCQAIVHGRFCDPTFTLIPSYAFPAT